MVDYKSLDLPTQQALIQWVEWLRKDVAQSRDERIIMNNRIHDLKVELRLTTGRFVQLCQWLDVDPDNEVEVRQALQDAKALKRFKSREKGGHLRSGEGVSPNTLAHYEQKLADKKGRIRTLEVVVKRFRDRLVEAGLGVD
jgi:hypothetical protein